MQVRKLRLQILAAGTTVAVLAAACSSSDGAPAGSDASPEDSAENTEGDPAEDDPVTAPFEITESLPAAVGEVDSVVWSTASEPNGLDPARRARNNPSEAIRSAVCESLWRVNADKTVDPALAESVEQPDPLTLIYKIRDGVQFNDGTELTADDVVASLIRHMDPEVGSVVAGAFEHVDSIEATGPLEVTVTLSRPDYLFNQQMGGEAGRIESAAFLEEAGSDYGLPDIGLNCTGPFRFEQWSTGSSVTLVRNDNYWDDSHRALAETFTFVFPADGGARINALVAGEIDGGYNTPEAASGTLTAADSGRLYFGPGTITQSMITNQNGIFGDLRVRQAISLAMDRQGLAEAGYGSYATPARVPISEYAWQSLGGDRARQIYQGFPDTSTRDVDRARELVSEAGVQGETIVIAYIPQVPPMVAMANATFAAAQEIGLEVEMLEMAPPDFGSLQSSPDAKDEHGVDIWPVSYRQALADPLETFVTFRTGNGFNYGGYSNAEYDAAVDDALGEADDEARAEMVAELAMTVAEELPWIPLVHPAYTLYINDRLGGAPATIEGLGPWAALIGSAD